MTSAFHRLALPRARLSWISGDPYLQERDLRVRVSLNMDNRGNFLRSIPLYWRTPMETTVE